ncbi:hypothetical protein SAMN06297382_2166 [Amphiplicatus metriothermophilus]|uniref:Uncharacterized protein n=1 Tax=Amphiplicatus metriothermophilus TaxID=1519374 RepID=A0A239PVH2_9PROT|nr:hypothetical protein SAMN06297382_2166 [Amphiplicatus metriothermophilus]
MPSPKMRDAREEKDRAEAVNDGRACAQPSQADKVGKRGRRILRVIRMRTDGLRDFRVSPVPQIDFEAQARLRDAKAEIKQQ